MNLTELIQEISPAERRMLAAKVGKSPAYLYFVAMEPTRRLGPELCVALARVEKRLSLADMRPDLWGMPTMKLWREPTPRRGRRA